MRAVLTVLSILVPASAALAESCSTGFFGPDMCAEAETARVQIAPLLPRQVADSLTWQDIAADGPRLIGTMVWEMPAATLDARLQAAGKTRADLADELVGFTTTIVCGQAAFREFIAAGGMFQFDYRTQDGAAIGSIPLKAC